MPRLSFSTTVDGADQLLIVKVGRKQIRMTWAHAAVATDIQVPAFVCCDHTNILALCLGALASAT